MATPSADVMAIANLLKRERYYRDTAQWDLCRDSFHPDTAATYINVAWYEGNVEDFLRQSAQMHKGKVNIIHSSFDPVDIRVCGDRAISEAFCLITSSLTLGTIDYELASHMRLFTRLQKVSGLSEWRLLSLESSYVRDRLVTAFPAFPGSDASDDSFPESSPLVITNEVLAYPKSYRYLALVMLKRGLKPRPNLPHEDSPESVRRISDRNRAFLDNAEAGFG
ncbi:hypothetical protein JMJ35_007590 [Cladonia borealis]|uniref:SnoaL-like domain-containing protein n=1 Tax=Cladonia borealis TaxID=184061 RepID=A0AA39QXF2_9LECA|nr:hypothetical protein JMJ35_007590 [Cladonia borealis]